MDSSSLINHKLLMMNWNVVHVMILAYITTSSIESSVIGEVSTNLTFIYNSLNSNHWCFLWINLCKNSHIQKQKTQTEIVGDSNILHCTIVGIHTLKPLVTQCCIPINSPWATRLMVVVITTMSICSNNCTDPYRLRCQYSGFIPSMDSDEISHRKQRSWNSIAQ